MSFYPASQLNTSPLVYIVGREKQGILPESGAGFFWGPSGSGKTFTILDLALAIGNGTSWLGYDTTPGMVAYAAGEGGPGLGLRIKARELRQGQDDTRAIADVARTQGDEAARAFAAALPPYTSKNIIVTDKPFPMHFVSGNKPNEDLAQAVAELRRQSSPPEDASDETLEKWPYLRLVILDALENFAGTLSVSNRSSANRIVNTMQWMAKELQCCVLAVAHPVGQGENQKMVGSDRLKAAADFVIRYAPDDVAAPGALPTATISCEKSKDDTKFDSFGVELHPCEWDEPRVSDDSNWEPVPLLDEETGEQALDGHGNPAWITDRVTSQTVRLIGPAAAVSGPPPGREPAPVPELRDNRPRSRVRPVLRPERRNGLHAVPDLPGAVPVPASVLERKAETAAALDARVTPPAIVPAPGPSTAQQDLVRSLLAVRCPDCSRAKMGCDVCMPPTALPLARTASGQSYIHESRILEAALAQPDPEAFLDGAIRSLTAAAARSAPAPRPAARTPLDDRLSWTTVRPDSPAPSLAEIMAGS